MRSFLFAFLGLSCWAKDIVKIGGPIQTTGVGGNGKAAFDLWKTWADGAADLGWGVSLNWKDSSDIAAAVASLTKPGDEKVDVLICPYTSGGSKTAIAAIHADWDGIVLVWGGASDSIFSTDCNDKEFICVGTLTVASKYMTSSLDKMNVAHNADLKVGLLENNNAFSAGVCAGAKARVESTAGLTLLHHDKLDAGKTAPGDADKAKVNAIMAKEPDVLVICGHNKFVEPVIETALGATKKPKAIIATNAITAAAAPNYASQQSMDCLIQPTQWAEHPTDKDALVGWTTAAFKTALGDKATYHAASAGAAAIAVSLAMNQGTAGSRIQGLKANLAKLDSPSFYGKIKFDEFGRIEKPMYGEQRQGGVNKIVAPTGNLMADYATCKAAKADTNTQTSNAQHQVMLARMTLVLSLVLRLLQ